MHTVINNFFYFISSIWNSQYVSSFNSSEMKLVSKSAPAYVLSEQSAEYPALHPVCERTSEAKTPERYLWLG